MKEFVKNRIVFQYIRYFLLKIKGYKYESKKDMLKTVLYVIKQYRIIENRNDKMRQYKKMIFYLSNFYEENTKKRFIYDIDENCTFVNKKSVIGNIPVNYQIILGTPFNDLETKICNNEKNLIVKNNKEIMHLMVKYVENILKKTNDNAHIYILQRVLNEKKEDLECAIQKLLFWNAWLWQTGHIHNGLGRLDLILWKSYLNGKEKGEKAKEVVKDFLLTLHEHYLFKSKMIKGDTGQIIILGGNMEDGNYFCNELTYIFLECAKELHLPDPKILLRVGKRMPSDLIRLACECIKTGIGSPILSNDEIVIPALRKFGYGETDAFNYVVSACWEPLSYGNSLEQNNIGSIEYAKVLTETLNDLVIEDDITFEDLIVLCHKKLENHIDRLLNQINKIQWEEDPLLSFFTEGCLEKGMDISDGGAKYNNYGITSVGMGNFINSLLNIKIFVYEKNIFELKDVREALKRNYDGYSDMRKVFQNGPLYFGMDVDEVIDITKCTMKVTENKLEKFQNQYGGKVKFGLSSPFYISNAINTPATADGRSSGAPLDVHISSKQGIAYTDIVTFASRLDYNGLKSNGNVVDLILQQNIIENHFKQFQEFVCKSIEKGFFQMQFNVVSYDMLKDAQIHPENHRNLIVRVWGFSAYFNDLPEEYQNVLIERAAISEAIYR